MAADEIPEFLNKNVRIAYHIRGIFVPLTVTAKDLEEAKPEEQQTWIFDNQCDRISSMGFVRDEPGTQRRTNCFKVPQVPCKTQYVFFLFYFLENARAMNSLTEEVLSYEFYFDIRKTVTKNS